MKKHTTDELFARKLADFSATPSQRANDLFAKRLASQQQTKAKGSIWLSNRPLRWAAAACIVLAAGIVSVQLLHDTSDSSLANAPQNTLPTPSTTAGVQEEKASGVNTFVQTQSGAADAPKIFVASSSLPKVKTVEMTSPTVEESLLQNTSVAVVKNEPNTVINSVITEKENNQPRVTPMPEQAAVIVISSLPATEADVVADWQDEPVTDSDTQPLEKTAKQRTFLATVVTELQNLKKGEKVNMTELARESEQALVISENGFIKSETAELSERWQRLKGLFDGRK